MSVLLKLEEAKLLVPKFEFLSQLVAVSPDDQAGNVKDGRTLVDLLCSHWSAGSYRYAAPHYHGSVLWDVTAKIATFVQTISIRDKGSHLWRRNTHCLGYALAAMGDQKDAYGRKVGMYRPAREQLVLLAYAWACTAGILGIDLRGSVTKQKMKTTYRQEDLIPVSGQTVVFPTLTDHGSVAVADTYANLRYDVGDYNDEIYETAIAFRDWITAGLIPNRMVGFLK